MSFFEFSERINELSKIALKKAEDGDGFIMRVYNVSETEQTATITFDQDKFGEIYASNMNEQIFEFLGRDEINIGIYGKEIKTLYVKQIDDRDLWTYFL